MFNILVLYFLGLHLLYFHGLIWFVRRCTEWPFLSSWFLSVCLHCVIVSLLLLYIDAFLSALSTVCMMVQLCSFPYALAPQSSSSNIQVKFLALLCNCLVSCSIIGTHHRHLNGSTAFQSPSVQRLSYVGPSMRCGWAPQAVPYIVLQTPEVDISYSDYIISLLLVRSAANADEFYGLVALYKSQITNTTTAVAPISGCVCLLSVSLPSYICVMSDKCWWLRLAWQLQTLPVQHSHPICLPPPVPPSIPPIPSETPWLEQSVCLTHRTSVCFASVYKFVVVVEWHSFACRTVSGCVGLRLAWPAVWS